MISISGPSLTATFQYDAFGRRVNKTINGVSTNYLFDDLNVVKETTTSSTVDFLVTGWDEVFSWTDGGGSLGILRDGQGSTIALADSSGVVQTSYTYDPFGNTTSTGTSSSNSTQFTGRENDGTGLYFYRSRYYSPDLQRFISEDPVGISSGINVYAYVANDPVNFTDPFGQSSSRYKVHVHQWSVDRVLKEPPPPGPGPPAPPVPGPGDPEIPIPSPSGRDCPKPDRRPMPPFGGGDDFGGGGAGGGW